VSLVLARLRAALKRQHTDYHNHMKLRIDSHVQDISTVWMHHQDDPYPGGHRYELHMLRSEASKYFDELAEGETQISDTEERDFMWPLQAVFDNFQNLEYVINTVNKVVVNEQGVTIYGVFSPFIRQ
jgi:hypothetical protein